MYRIPIIITHTTSIIQEVSVFQFHMFQYVSFQDCSLPFCYTYDTR